MKKLSPKQAQLIEMLKNSGRPLVWWWENGPREYAATTAECLEKMGLVTIEIEVFNPQTPAANCKKTLRLK